MLRLWRKRVETCAIITAIHTENAGQHPGSQASRMADRRRLRGVCRGRGLRARALCVVAPAPPASSGAPLASAWA